MRRAARIDDNQNEIVNRLRELGASVEILSAVGKGCPDILVGYNGHNYLIEIKDGSKPPSKRKLTPDQKIWHSKWLGHVSVCKSLEDAIMVVLDA